jgi:hypothetical protein
MTDALARDAFAKGVARAGDAKWSQAAQGKGAERFGPGAAAGVNDYQQGVQKYTQVIESTQLPPRGPKGDPRNIERVRVLAAALRKAKTGSALLHLVLGLGCASLVAALVVWAWPRSLSKGASGGSSSQSADGGHRSAALRGCAGFGLVALVAGAIACSGSAIDTVTFSATAPGAAGAAAAAVAGDSAAIRNTPIEQKPFIMQLWVKSQVSAFAQVTHPSGHDQVRDIRVRHVAATPLPMFAHGYPEPVEPQENLTVTLAGSAVAGQVELITAMVYYPELPGVMAKLIDTNSLSSRMVQLVTVEDTTTATASGAYSGARALNAASDLLIANTDYAIVGAHIGGICGALTIRGVDSGNLRIPIPGMPGRPDLTAWWFALLSEEFGIPCIPVFNSANKAGIFIENITDQALAAVPFSLLMAQLAPG